MLSGRLAVVVLLLACFAALCLSALNVSGEDAMTGIEIVPPHLQPTESFIVKSDASRASCGEALLVHNGTKSELKIVYQWTIDEPPLIPTIPAEGIAEIRPAYCQAFLFVVTAGELVDRVEADSSLAYSVTWSIDKQKYVFQTIDEPEPVDF